MTDLRTLLLITLTSTTLTLGACSDNAPQQPGITAPALQAAPHPLMQGDGTGRLIIFQDYRSIGMGFIGHYGPTNGFGFDANFMADVSYSVWSLDDVEIGGAQLSEKTKTVPLNPAGFGLEAVYRGEAPEVAATCIIHPTPVSKGRKALIMQFWRAVPERLDKTTGSKHYDEAAPALVGWADAEYACAEALNTLDELRANAVWGPNWKTIQAEARKTLD